MVRVQARLGPALEPYRAKCFLAAKTMFRDAAGAAADLAKTLKVGVSLCTPWVSVAVLQSGSSSFIDPPQALRTDHLDLYQVRLSED